MLDRLRFGLWLCGAINRGGVAVQRVGGASCETRVLHSVAQQQSVVHDCGVAKAARRMHT